MLRRPATERPNTCCRKKLDHAIRGGGPEGHKTTCRLGGEHYGGTGGPPRHAPGNDETIHSFGARIRGQANVCQYNTACPNCSTIVDFTDCILRDVLARGIADNEIQPDLLGDAKQDMTLEEMLKFVESKESGKRSASRLHDYSKGPQTAAASSYNRLRRQAHKDCPAPLDGEHKLCSYCGKKGHGLKSPTSIRRSECPAFNHTCKHCNCLHHFETICRSKNKAKPAPPGRSANPPRTPAPSANENAVFIFDQPSNGVVFDSLWSLSSSTANNNGQCSVSLDHHTYNQLTDTWVRQASKPQPFIKVTATISTSGYTAFGLTITKPTTPVTFSAITDTGCQSCLAGISAIHRLGMTRKDLIPVTLQMHAANNAKIAILGAAILQFSGQSNSGKTLVSRQLVYITDSTDKVFLSREACTDLGLISRQFPSISEALLPPGNKAISHSSLAQQPPVITKQEAPQHDSGLTAPCDCPKRQLPPPKPKSIPFPPTDENREKLQQWLLSYYQSSSFNMCHHQPLPMMDSPPMRLMVDPEATPVAQPKPLPVPLHWQEEIKAGLNQDVRLGVIEIVAITPPCTRFFSFRSEALSRA